MTPLHPHPRPRPFDWDRMLTFGLTAAVVLLSGGMAYLAAAVRVLRAARVGVPSPQDGDWLLVPGKRLRNGHPDRDFAARLDRAAGLAARPPGHPICILGGDTGGAGISEAAAGAAFLRGLPGGERLRLHLETESLDTLTNLRNVRELLGRWAPGASVVLVSNRYHLARLGLLAASLGLPHRLCPAEPVLPRDWPTARRLVTEAFYCLWFQVGKGWAILIRSRRMLGRVT